jgi:hypothetical protein
VTYVCKYHFFKADVPHRIHPTFEEAADRAIVPLSNHGGPVMAAPGSKEMFSKDTFIQKIV